MPVPFRRLASGTILVDIAEPTGQSRVVLYVRVSSHDRRSDLDRQVSRLTGWATDSGLAVGQVVPRSVRTSRVQRPKLARVLSDPLCHGDCYGASESAGSVRACHQRGLTPRSTGPAGKRLSWWIVCGGGPVNASVRQHKAGEIGPLEEARRWPACERGGRVTLGGEARQAFEGIERTRCDEKTGTGEV